MNSLIGIFKTDVQNKTQARLMTHLLKAVFFNLKINFDLDDCDKILRVEGLNELYSQEIINDLGKLGFKCEVLN